MGWLPDEQWLATACVTGECCLYNVETGDVVRSFKSHTNGALCLAVASDGSRVYTGGQDGFVRVHNTQTGETIAEDRGDGRKSWVEQLAISTTGIIATAAGRTVRFWDPSGAFLSEVTGLPSTPTAIAWSTNPATASSLHVACYGGVFTLSPGQAAPIRTREWKGSLIALRPSPDGRKLAVGTQDDMVLVWVDEIDKPLKMEGYPRKVREFAWSNDSLTLATGGAASVIAWDFGGKGPQGSAAKQLSGHEDVVIDLVSLPNADVLLSSARDGSCFAWSAHAPHNALFNLISTSPLTKLAPSPSGKQLATAAENGELTMYRWALTHLAPAS